MKLFTCFHPQKKHVGIRCWNLGWGGKAWPFSRHGSTLQEDGDQALNRGAALFIHFAWSGAGETLAHRERGEHKKARANDYSGKWPLYSIYLTLLHILTLLLITWSWGNRLIIQAIFVLIASGFPRHLAHVQNEERKAFMGVKFYKKSLIYKTDHILMAGGGCKSCFDHGLFCAINLLLCIPEMAGKPFCFSVSPLLCHINLTYSYCILVLITEIRQCICHKWNESWQFHVSKTDHTFLDAGTRLGCWLHPGMTCSRADCIPCTSIWASPTWH